MTLNHTFNSLQKKKKKYLETKNTCRLLLLKHKLKGFIKLWYFPQNPVKSP